MLKDICNYQIEVDFIGEGSWTRAYHQKEENSVYLEVNGCPFKASFSKVKHLNLPKIEELGGGWFKSPFYSNEFSSTQTEIIEILADCYSKTNQIGRVNADTLLNFVNLVSDDLGDTYTEVLLICNSLLLRSSAIEPSYDIGTSNFGVDNFGNLIFRDVLADFGLLE